MLSGILALVASALFTGAALYINAVEQPARLRLDDRSLLTEWKPAYERGTLMQAPLAVASFLLGAGAWWATGRAGFLAGGVLLLLNLPWTFLGVMPVNRILMATEPAAAGSETRSLVRRWNRLHGVRTAFGALGTAAMVLALA